MIEVPLDHLHENVVQPEWRTSERAIGGLRDVVTDEHDDAMPQLWIPPTIAPLSAEDAKRLGVPQAGHYSVLDGHRRVKLAREQGYTSIWCMLDDIEDAHAQHQRFINLNVATRRVNGPELLFSAFKDSAVTLPKRLASQKADLIKWYGLATARQLAEQRIAPANVTLTNRVLNLFAVHGVKLTVTPAHICSWIRSHGQNDVNHFLKTEVVRHPSTGLAKLRNAIENGKGLYQKGRAARPKKHAA